MQVRATSSAISDITAALRHLSLVGMLGWKDVRQRYRRSLLGPFWLTISKGLMIGTIAIVFGQIFDASLTEYLPFLTVGMIFWSFIASVINEGCYSFISSEEIIKQLPLPLFVHILRTIWRNILILAHNLVIFPLVLFSVSKPLTVIALFSVPGFLLAVLNLAWVALILAILSTRYRDLPQSVASILQVLFYLTPIMWMPDRMPERAHLFWLELNPTYHLLEIVRAPLLGQSPTQLNWEISFIMALLGWGLTLAMYSRYKRRIAYWL